MVKNSKQNWEVGSLVNVGFLRNLKVIKIILTPGDFAPDAYILLNQSNGNQYKFVPHNGLELISRK